MMARPDFIFVECAIGESGDKEFPETGCSTVRHGMAAPIPFIEVADNTDSRSVRRPDYKMDSGNTSNRPEMSAHCVVGFEEGAFGKEMQLKIGKERCECIGIVPLRDLSC